MLALAPGECKSDRESALTAPAIARYTLGSWPRCTMPPRSTSRRSSSSRRRASSRSGPGSSSASGSRRRRSRSRSNRLVGGGYTELLDDRSLRLTDEGPRARRPRSCAATGSPSACSSTSSGSSGRRSTARPTAGSTRSRPTSRRSSSSCSATRPRARTATRSPARSAPGRHDGRTSPSPTPSPARSTVARISEKLELDKDALGLLASTELIPGRDARSSSGAVADGVAVTTGDRRAHGARAARPAHVGDRRPPRDDQVTVNVPFMPLSAWSSMPQLTR